MKKLGATLVVSALLLSLPLSSTFAAVKTGDSCKKVGTVSVSKGFKYTCTAQGKKKAWGKGVKVVSNSSSQPSPTPTPQPTPSPSPTPTPTPTPTPVLTLAQKWISTGSRALEGFDQAFPQKPSQFPALETIWRISDNVNPQISGEIQRQYKESIDFWSAYTKHEGVLQVIVGTLDDIEFVCKWRNSYLEMQDSGCTRSFRTDKTRTWDAHTTQLATKATDFYFISDPATLKEGSFLPRVPHEFFHNVQYAQTTRYKSLLPCWAEEGGAEYFGILISSQGDVEAFLKRRYQPLTDNRGNVMKTQLTQADWKAWLTSTDMNSIIQGSSTWGCEKVQMEGIYSYGLLATEYLNIKLGTSGLLTLYKDAGIMGWDKAIEKSFNTSKSDAYDEIAAYMSAEHRINLTQAIIRR